METYNPPKEAEDKEDNSNLPEREVLSEKWLLEKIDSLIPLIKENNWEISEKIEPIESQLEELLEELNNTLRPKIESPIRKKPLLSIAIAAGIGLLIGTLLNSGRK